MRTHAPPKTTYRIEVEHGRRTQVVATNLELLIVEGSVRPFLCIGFQRLQLAHNVTATALNQGFQPTELAIRVQQRRAVPVRASLEGDGLEVLSGDARQELGVLAGFGSAEVSWVVRGEPGATVRVHAWHPKAGRAGVELRLGG